MGIWLHYSGGIDQFGCFPWEFGVPDVGQNFLGCRHAEDRRMAILVAATAIPRFHPLVQVSLQFMPAADAAEVDRRGTAIRVGDVKAMPIAALVRTHRSQA